MENEQRHYELRSGSRSRSRTPLIQTTLIEPETLEHHYDLRSQSREKSYIPGEIANNKKSGFKISYVIYIILKILIIIMKEYINLNIFYMLFKLSF